jgi:hypothetical protein
LFVVLFQEDYRAMKEMFQVCNEPNSIPNVRPTNARRIIHQAVTHVITRPDRCGARHCRAIAVFGWKTAEKYGRVGLQVVEVIQTTSPAGNS